MLGPQCFAFLVDNLILLHLCQTEVSSHGVCLREGGSEEKEEANFQG